MRFFLLASFPDSIIAFRGALISRLVQAGEEVHVAAPGMLSGSPVRSTLEAGGIVVHDLTLDRTGTSALGDLLLVFRLYRLFRRVRPDAILGYTIKPVIYGTLAAWIARVPERFALITGLGYAFTGARNSFLISLIRRIYGLALGRATKVFFQNPDDRALFQERGILPLSIPAVVVNGSGIDIRAFNLEPLPGKGAVFLMIGRLLGDKGVREFVAAARLIRILHPVARFQLVGWIDENPDAISKSELNEWVAEGVIEFLGRLEDVRSAIAGCNVYVLPSYREGTPRTVLEAMAMGRPVITTDAPGCRETVTNGENGFLVPVGSVDALVTAMLRLIEDRALLIRMGGRSRQIAEEKYDVHKVNEVMLREMGITSRESAMVKHD
ncbi:glycosyl transferase [Rhodanobacter sp. Root561]|uniref:glycosyltransferase family 4 protein n=1 Tax=Rhodanobacter sp. Root561 TaxID=1736560 RepID=UPI000700C12E|nr:glycosyltransferase family 4 protein [Rhodanobacter sp. Root561]KQZ79835.1 glycosyl transferase [Rhodanobacter sp. Root561]